MQKVIISEICFSLRNLLSVKIIFFDLYCGLMYEYFVGKGGHTGCSESFNLNNYEDLAEWNSQGREQLHSLLEKVSKTLRTFMIWLV